MDLAREKLKLIFTLLVKPILEYGVTVWAPYTRCGINKLESIQRHAAHFVTSEYHKTSSITEMINTLNWTSIESRNRELHLLTFYKIIHGCVNLSLPLTKLFMDAYKFSFSTYMIQQWNSLPDKIVSAQSIDLFRLKLLNFIIL